MVERDGRWRAGRGDGENSGVRRETVEGEELRGRL